MNQNETSQKSNSQLGILFIFVIIIFVILFLIFKNKQKTASNDLTLRKTSQETTSNQNLNQLSQTTNTELSNTNKNQTNQQNTNQPEITPMSKTNMPKPEMIIDPSKQYIATMKTNYGDIKIQLYAQQTPKTVNNFVYLAQSNFYDGLIFHRVIKDFMIQGGCPLGNGTGNPGYQFEDESNPEPLVRGSLAMANSGPNTNGSQFFIVTAEETPWLNGKHTNFGKVIEGLETVMKIEQVQTGANDKPVQDVIINSLTISES